MTVVAAVVLEDHGVYMASDSAVGYESGYRRAMTQGKWWRLPHCVIGESGCDLHLSRIRANLPECYFEKEGIQNVIHNIQDDIKGNEGIDCLDAELLYAGPESGLWVIGGDGGLIGPYDFISIGHGAVPVNSILEYALRPSRCRKRTRTAIDRIVKESFRICERQCDSVTRPFYSDVFYV